MACAICETRRPRRFCPGVRGDICAPCCGAEREVTVDCPLDCEYLQEARKHDRQPSLEGVEMPHADVKITDQLIERNSDLLTYMAGVMLRTLVENPQVIDYDVREALDALARTYRSLESGIYYETRPANPLAAAVFGALQGGIQEFRTEEQRALGLTRTRDADVMALIVFLRRVELDRNNGRRRGRAFLDSLRRLQPAEAAPAPEGSSLIVP